MARHQDTAYSVRGNESVPLGTKCHELHIHGISDANLILAALGKAVTLSVRVRSSYCVGTTQRPGAQRMCPPLSSMQKPWRFSAATLTPERSRRSTRSCGAKGWTWDKR